MFSVCLFVCMSVCLTAGLQPDFHVTWKGVAPAKEGPIKFEADPIHGADTLICFHFCSHLERGHFLCAC